MTDTACKNCNKALSSEILENDKPCPNCGSKLRTYHLKVETGHYKITGYPISFKLSKWVKKRYPILLVIFILLTVLSFVFSYVISGIIGIIISLVLGFFAYLYGEEKEDKYLEKEV